MVTELIVSQLTQKAVTRVQLNVNNGHVNAVLKSDICYWKTPGKLICSVCVVGEWFCFVCVLEIFVLCYIAI